MLASIATIGMRILTFGITIPVVLIVAVAGWFWLDKNSSVRKAVDEAMMQAVAGAELEAANAKSESLAKTVAELRDREEELRSANATFAGKLNATKTELENANERIADLASQPVDPGCRINADVLNRLRNK